MFMTKKEFFKIILTAVFSAGIAMLQNMLASMGSDPNLQVDPATAGGIGAAITAVRKYLA
jgi:hypothetical protein